MLPKKQTNKIIANSCSGETQHKCNDEALKSTDQVFFFSEFAEEAEVKTII